MDRSRATTSTGAVVDEPTAVQLADLVAEVDRSGRDAFLVVERGRDAVDHNLQVRRSHDGWVLDLHDGEPSRHYQAEVADPALVYSAVAHWTLRARTWPGVAWQRLSAA